MTNETITRPSRDPAGKDAPRRAVTRLVVLLGIATAFLLGTSCSCDPCAHVECPPGEKCIDGECVPDDQFDGIPCSRDEDCAGVQGRTRCDPETNMCVECLEAGHCPDPVEQICDPEQRFCVARPPCETHDDCADLPANPWCDEDSGKCRGCLTDDHCEGRQQRCHEASGTCRFTHCKTDDDCGDYADAPLCHVDTGVCVECTKHEQCEEFEVCRRGFCEPVGECSRDADCEGVAERCDPVTQTCVQCVDHADCRLGGRCVANICRQAVACETDAHCGAPLRCLVETAQCLECLDDGHCLPGQVCHEGLCAGSGECGPGVFCGPGEECVDGECAYFECPEDGYAAGLLPYRGRPVEPGALGGLSICPNTWHWFYFEARMGDGLFVDLEYETATDHPDLAVWLGTGEDKLVVGEPEVTSSGQSLEATFLPQPGPVWVGIRGVNEHLEADLSIEVVEGGLCDDDEFEPNHHPTLATPLPSPVNGHTSVEAIACLGNEDWFYLPVSAGLRVIAGAYTNGPEENPLTLTLHWRSPAGFIDPIAGGTNFSAETPPLPESSEVYFQVTGGTKDGVPYELEVRLRPPPPSNDTCHEVDVLKEDEWVEGTTAGAEAGPGSACGGEGSPAVVYGFSLEQRRAVTIVTEGYLDTLLSLRSECDEPGAEVACSDEPGDVEVLEAVLPPGDWYVWVANHEGREGAFDIRLETTEPPPAPSNDACDSAAPLDVAEGGGVEEGDITSAAWSVAPSCGEPGGDAFYHLSLDEAASLHAKLNAASGMSLSVRSDCENDETEIICKEVPAGGSAELDLTYLPAGDYTVVISGGGISGGEYTLTWGLGSPVPPPLNDDCDSAWPLDIAGGPTLVEGDTTGATDAHEATCAMPGSSGPDVVYWFFLAEPRSVEAVLEAEFDAVLDLRGLDCRLPEASLTCDDSSPARIFHPELPAGRYHLLVDGYSGESGPFTLSVGAGDPLPPPTNDVCEEALLLDLSNGEIEVEGHTIGASNDIDIGSECTGSSTAGPDVVYAVDLEAGWNLTVTVTPEEGFAPSLYVLESCDAEECLVGADEWFVSKPEQVSLEAQWDGRYYIVVDSWNEGEAGRFDLTVAVE